MEVGVGGKRGSGRGSKWGRDWDWDWVGLVEEKDAIVDPLIMLVV